MKSLPALLEAFGCVFLALMSPLVHATGKPNVILVMADDQGWGDMGYMNHEVLKTPVFDEMAGTGLRFDRFYAAAPVCSPTRASVLTGRHPNRMGLLPVGPHPAQARGHPRRGAQGCRLFHGAFRQVAPRFGARGQRGGPGEKRF